MIVSSQGYLQFAGPNSTGYDTPSQAGLLANARIAPFWAPFYTAGTGGGTFVSATATSVTFEWVGYNPITGSPPVNFAATLNNNGTFSFAYGAGNANLNPVIGVSAGNGRILGQTPVYVLSSTNGSATMANAPVQTWTPTPSNTWFDIGAFEFQGSTADKTPPTVVSVSTLPANNASTGLAFTSLTITFSKSLDLVSASSPANYSLIEADPNGQFNTTGATVIPVTPIYVIGSKTVTLQLPNGVLAAGKYQLTLSGTRAIFDQSGNALAGNGTSAGTNYIRLFTIDRTADQPPVATAQSDSVAEDGSVQIILSSTTAPGFPASYTITTQPANGTLSAITNGNTITYTPNANYYGPDNFSFQATDPDGGNSQAKVTLTVTPVDQAPTAIAASVNVTHDKAQTIVLGGADAETPASQLTYTIATQPTHGTLTAVPGSANAFTYTPAAAYLGADSFSFTVTDTGNPVGNLANRKTSAPATVAVTVVDPAPVGVADTYTTRAGVPMSIPAATGVLANDTDAAGDTLTATLGTGPAHGTLMLSTNGSFVYTPTAGFTGTDTFTYLPHGTYIAAAAPTAVSISVTAGAPPPPPPPTGTGKGGAPPPPAPGGAPLAAPHASFAAMSFSPSVSSATVSPQPLAATAATDPAPTSTAAPAAPVSLQAATPTPRDRRPEGNCARHPGIRSSPRPAGRAQPDHPAGLYRPRRRDRPADPARPPGNLRTCRRPSPTPSAAWPTSRRRSSPSSIPPPAAPDHCRPAAVRPALAADRHRSRRSAPTRIRPHPMEHPIAMTEDHKIADMNGSAEPILNEVLPPPPSRR